MKPYIIKERCAAQENICPPLKECQQNAYSYIKDEAEPLGGRIEINLDVCIGCGKCSEICCGNCIEMK